MAFMKAKIACRHSAWESALESRIKAPFGKQIVAVDVLIFRDVWRDSFGGLECGVLNTGRNSKSSTTSRARMSWTSTLPGLKAEIKWISGFFAHMCGQQVQIRIVKDHRNCQITVLFDIPTPRFCPLHDVRLEAVELVYAVETAAAHVELNNRRKADSMKLGTETVLVF